MDDRPNIDYRLEFENGSVIESISGGKITRGKIRGFLYVPEIMENEIEKRDTD
jgi:hypothetical protein